MSSSDQCPFGDSEPARREIWHMLVARDSDAFLACDWDAIAADFINEGFFGLDARGRPDPDDWRLTFPTLAAYRAEWLRQAEDATHTVDPALARAALMSASELLDIDIRGGTALARKRFDGSLPHRDGTRTRLHWQSLYVCRHHQGRWKIASFVGYLPYGTDRGPAHFPAAVTQHRTAGPYTPVVGVESGARLFVLSGQAPLDLEGRVVGSTFIAQARATLENCRLQLTNTGLEFRDVFKATVYLTDLANWAAFNEIYCEFMRPPYAARTAVQAGLLPGFMVEVELWAVRR